MSTIISVETCDVRFPTSQQLDGSDAMNADPDYSAAYVTIGTDASDGLEGHGFLFTIRRGDQRASGAPAWAKHRGALGRHGRDIPTFHARLTVAVARAGKGHHAHGHRCGCQCPVGSAGETSRDAAVATAIGPEPRRDPIAC